MWSKQTLQFEIKTIHYFELELAEYYAKNIDHKQEFCLQEALKNTILEKVQTSQIILCSSDSDYSNLANLETLVKRSKQCDDIATQTES